MLSLFMHSVIPHHHHDREECDTFGINGIADVHSFDDCAHDHASYNDIHNDLEHGGKEHSESDHDVDHDADEDTDHHSDHHSCLNCHFHADITVLTVLDFNFLLPDGIKIIAFKVENEVAYYLEPEVYNFSPEEHHFRRGPPTSFMG